MSTKQDWLPGAKPKRIGPVIDAAGKVLETVDRQKAAKKARDGAEAELINQMRKAKIQGQYRFDGLTITIDKLEKVKVVKRATVEEEKEFE